MNDTHVVSERFTTEHFTYTVVHRPNEHRLIYAARCAQMLWPGIENQEQITWSSPAYDCRYKTAIVQDPRVFQDNINVRKL